MVRYVILALDDQIPTADAYSFGDDHGEMEVSTEDARAHVACIVSVEADSELEDRLDRIIDELKAERAA